MNCCFRAKLDDYIIIQPGETGTLSFEFDTKFPGPFENGVPVFVDDGRWLRQAEVGVKGTAYPSWPMLLTASKL